MNRRGGLAWISTTTLRAAADAMARVSSRIFLRSIVAIHLELLAREAEDES